MVGRRIDPDRRRNRSGNDIRVSEEASKWEHLLSYDPTERAGGMPTKVVLTFDENLQPDYSNAIQIGVFNWVNEAGKYWVPQSGAQEYYRHKPRKDSTGLASISYRCAWQFDDDVKDHWFDSNSVASLPALRLNECQDFTSVIDKIGRIPIENLSQ